MTVQPTIFKVTDIMIETSQMKLFTLIGETSWSFVPGQVAVLGLEGQGESYFAISSAPEDKGGMDFLIKDGKGVAASLFRLNTGASIIGKGPLGKGFPVQNYQGRDFLMAAVGSAISPMRSVIRSMMHSRDKYGKVTFIYGVRSPGDLPFANEIQDWEKSGINVTITVSQPEGTNWVGKSGHVQSYFGDIMKNLTLPVALICGMKTMQDESREALVRLGIPPAEVLTNY